MMHADAEQPVVLVTGGTGQVGFELVRELSPIGRVIAPDRSALDLARPESIRAYLRNEKPLIVVNAAAYTNVDQAEKEPDLCMAVNATGPAILAEECRARESVLVHYSTDYVFDGQKRTPYSETDAERPLNVYGRSKLAGEVAIRETLQTHLIIRCGWVYGLRGRNFLRTILRLAEERDEITIVDDQVGTPTWSRLIATSTALLVRQLLLELEPSTLSETRGVYNMPAGGSTTWHGFASAILEEVALSRRLRCSRVLPIRTHQYPTPAIRPKYSVLDGQKILGRFGLRLPHWRDQLRMALGGEA
jgi:dTDP-4-dehydrorhamnose reductase